MQELSRVNKYLLNRVNKMIKVKMIIVLFVIIFTQVLVGQTNTIEDELLDQIESSSIHSLLNNEFKLNASVYSQMNSSVGNNSNVLHQGNGNISIVNQNGDENYAVLTRYGNGNSDIVTQNGNDNSYTSNITGGENKNQIDQNGNNNVIDQKLVGDGMDFTITQNGNNHELIQVENDGLTNGYEVTQSGNGMRITITNRVGVTR